MGIGEMVENARAACVAAEESSVRERAYELWQEAGCPESDGVEFWLKAEAQLVESWSNRLVDGNVETE